MPTRSSSDTRGASAVLTVSTTFCSCRILLCLRLCSSAAGAVTGSIETLGRRTTDVSASPTPPARLTAAVDQRYGHTTWDRREPPLEGVGRPPRPYLDEGSAER